MRQFGESLKTRLENAQGHETLSRLTRVSHVSNETMTETRWISGEEAGNQAIDRKRDRIRRDDDKTLLC